MPAGSAGAVKALTLADCYALALKTSGPLAVRRGVVEEAQGHYQTALGGVLPHVSYSYQYIHQNINPNTTLPSYFAAPDSTVSQLSLTQTLFSGFREFAGLSAAKQERTQRLLEEARTRQLILADVTDAFYTLYEQRESLKIFQDIGTVLNARLKDLAARVRVGRSRQADLASTQALSYQNDAQIEVVRSLIADAEKRLQYQIGRAPGELIDSEGDLVPPANPQEYTGRADSRADVAAARHAADIARQQVKIARADFYPTISLSGTYYAHRTGRFTGIDWDATVLGEIALLPVVQTLGTLKTAKARAAEARSQYELARLDARQDISVSFDNAQAAFSQTVAFKRALEAAEENYRLQQRDYGLNLISNLDLLQSIQILETARQNYLHAVYGAKRAYWRLKVAAGETL
jgi:outer membrane protein TolC